MSRSQRNPTALFGLGLIDAIPDEAIMAIAKREAMKTPKAQGRVSRLKDGKIGRLGWKAQTANTEDFVLNACRVELGLEVPDHHQAVSPQAPKYRTTGLDLTAGECNALVAYVRSLPRPAARKPAGAEEAKYLAAGKTTFAAVGCANCHTARLGEVEGLYSDLLLHDMGQEMADDGSYGDDGSDGDDPLDPSDDPFAARSSTKSPKPHAQKAATRKEWRTPPLWGFRDSGPYLHDGRAQTMEQAVALHGGQGADSARKFFELSPQERFQVEAFLKSLVAPLDDTARTAWRVAFCSALKSHHPEAFLPDQGGRSSWNVSDVSGRLFLMTSPAGLRHSSLVGARSVVQCDERNLFETNSLVPMQHSLCVRAAGPVDRRSGRGARA